MCLSSSSILPLPFYVLVMRVEKCSIKTNDDDEREKKRRIEWREKNKIETSHMYKKWNAAKRARARAFVCHASVAAAAHIIGCTRASLKYFTVMQWIGTRKRTCVCSSWHCLCVSDGHRPNDSALQSQRMGEIYHKRHMILFRKIAAGNKTRMRLSQASSAHHYQ